VTKNKATDTLPDKHYFRIGEVAEHIGVKPYVLRYWETEFEQLNPEKSKMNQRQYSRADVDLLTLIAWLLHKRRFTIEGARKIISGLKGDWKGGLAALKSGRTAGTRTTGAAGPGARELAALRKKYASLERSFLKRDKEFRDLKMKYRKLEAEILALRKAAGPLFGLLKTELRGLLTLAEEDSPSGPSLHSDA